MTDTEVRERLGIVIKKRWTRDQFIEHYGIDLWEQGSSAWAQFRIWAERFPDGKTFRSNHEIDRWMFDRFIAHREWMPMRMVADQFAMPTDDLSRVLKVMAKKKYISELIEKGEVPGMYSKSLVHDLPKRLPSFPRKLFSSQSNFVRAFHETINKDLPGVSVHLVPCSASLALGENPPDVAYERDIITCQPIGISHQIWLDFGKPLALKPDACSIITFAKHEKILQSFCMGGIDPKELDSARAIAKCLVEG